MEIGDLVEKLGAELVGGRAVVVIDGKKTYLTNLGADGVAYLNDVGIRLRDEAATESPRPRGRPRKVVDTVAEPEQE